MEIRLNMGEAMIVNGEYGNRIICPIEIGENSYVLPIEVLSLDLPKDIIDLLKSRIVEEAE